MYGKDLSNAKNLSFIGNVLRSSHNDCVINKYLCLIHGLHSYKFCPQNWRIHHLFPKIILKKSIICFLWSFKSKQSSAITTIKSCHQTSILTFHSTAERSAVTSTEVVSSTGGKSYTLSNTAANTCPLLSLIRAPIPPDIGLKLRPATFNMNSSISGGFQFTGSHLKHHLCWLHNFHQCFSNCIISCFLAS